MNGQRFSWIRRHASPAGALLLGAVMLSGCSQGDDDDTVSANDTGTWRADVGSTDAAVRARAVDSVVGDPGDDGLATVEKLAVNDPDARVREQAVLAYRVLAGAEGERFLKDIALGDDDPNVVAAAQAALRLLREEHPHPQRAWMNVELPEAYRAGETVVMHVRFGSTEAAPKATIQVRPPKGFTVDDPSSLRWRGSVEAGVTQDLTFEMVAPQSPVEAGARVRLHVDYPEQLDDEVVQEHVRVRGDERGGKFEGPAPKLTRSVDGQEVQP